jgi:hypothetical protein
VGPVGHVGKKSKLVTPPNGVLPGFVPGATLSRSASESVTTAANSRSASVAAGAVPVNSQDSSSTMGDANSHMRTASIPSERDFKFKMGGLEPEGSNEDGSDAADKRYPKYTEANSDGETGFRVRNT